MNTYVGELRTLAQSCNFCTCLHDTLIRNQIVLGLRIGGTRESALKSLRVTKCQTYSKACGLDYDRVMSITWRLLGQRKQRQYPKQAGRKCANWKCNNDRVPSRDKPCALCGRKHWKGRSNCAADERLEEMRTSHDDEVLQQLKEVNPDWLGWGETRTPSCPISQFQFHEMRWVFMMVLSSKESDSPSLSRFCWRWENTYPTHKKVWMAVWKEPESVGTGPGMTAELKEYISQCDTCSKYMVRQ